MSLSLSVTNLFSASLHFLDIPSHYHIISLICYLPPFNLLTVSSTHLPDRGNSWSHSRRTRYKSIIGILGCSSTAKSPAHFPPYLAPHESKGMGYVSKTNVGHHDWFSPRLFCCYWCHHCHTPWSPLQLLQFLPLPLTRWRTSRLKHRDNTINTGVTE